MTRKRGNGHGGTPSRLALSRRSQVALFSRSVSFTVFGSHLGVMAQKFKKVVVLPQAIHCIEHGDSPGAEEDR